MFSELTTSYRHLTLFHGAARGVDTTVASWTRRLGWEIVPFPVSPEDWRTYGKAAGVIRNKRMAEAAADHAETNKTKLVCISIWDGESPGTKHMMKLVDDMGLEHWALGAQRDDAPPSTLF